MGLAEIICVDVIEEHCGMCQENALLFSLVYIFVSLIYFFKKVLKIRLLLKILIFVKYL